MEKKAYSQLELFFAAKDSQDARHWNYNQFLAGVWRYEKTILLMVGFIITGIIAFSLGVEKGKRITAAKLNSRIDMVESAPAKYPLGQKTENKPAPVINIKKQPPMAVQKKEIVKAPILPTDALSNYTIQVASFETKKYAQKETEVLKKNGYTALIISIGKYTVVCVGNYPGKENAKNVLGQLKKRYRDCFIRRL